jgi:SAM-dependent methyltransferase
VRDPLVEPPWDAKKQHYQQSPVAQAYDQRRFPQGHDDPATRRKWRAVLKLLAGCDDIRTVLDLPCGTGRFTGRLVQHGFRVIHADISMPMLEASRTPAALPLRADADRLPLRDGAVDLVFSIRFLMHVHTDRRVEVLRELARVSRRWLLLDVRHHYAAGYWWKWARRKAGLRVKLPEFRYNMRRLHNELQQAGLTVRARAWITPGFSEKLLILCERKES